MFMFKFICSLYIIIKLKQKKNENKQTSFACMFPSSKSNYANINGLEQGCQTQVLEGWSPAEFRCNPN